LIFASTAFNFKGFPSSTERANAGFLPLLFKAFMSQAPRSHLLQPMLQIIRNIFRFPIAGRHIKTSLPKILDMLWDAKLDDLLLWSELQELFISNSPQPKDKNKPLPATVIKIIPQILPSVAALLRTPCSAHSVPNPR
jgi:hypothetical protein